MLVICKVHQGRLNYLTAFIAESLFYPSSQGVKPTCVVVTAPRALLIPPHCRIQPLWLKYTVEFQLQIKRRCIIVIVRKPPQTNSTK